MAKQTPPPLLDWLKERWKTWFGTTLSPPPPPEPQGELSFYILPAHNGDSLLLVYAGDDGKEHAVWIDGGLVRSHREYGARVMEEVLKEQEFIDLMVVTHIDQDHIGGILAIVRELDFNHHPVKQFWFNSSRQLSNYFRTAHDRRREVLLENPEEGSRSVAQGMDLEDMLESSKVWHEKPIMQMQEYDLHGAHIRVLSPDQASLQKLNEHWQDELEEQATVAERGTDHQYSIEELAQRDEREDRSIPNGSSIAFLFEYHNRKLMLLGDAHSSVVVATLRRMGYDERNRLKVDVVKLSHHGSKASNTSELWNLVDAQQFVVSTDGSRHGLPNKEAMARILLHPMRNPDEKIRFIFNYDNQVLRGIFTEEEKQKYNFECVFPDPGQMGNVMEL